jgi:membrane protein implicated in regulation of membrane protease activity
MIRLVGSTDPHRSAVRFEPIGPAPRSRLIAALVVGPILWLGALVAAAWVSAYTWAIGRGLLVTFASFVVALIVLALMRAGRRREERRYEDRR